MGRTTRTFVAIELPDSVRERIGKVIDHLTPKAPPVRWVEPHQLHLTLAFLGDIPESDLRSVCQAVEQVVEPHARFELEFREFGSFPSGKPPRVLWLGVTGDLEPLQRLQRSVTAATRATGYPPTDARFHPHVTLGRVHPDGSALDWPHLVKPFTLWSAGKVQVKQVVTMASVLRPEGPAYGLLSKARLGARASTES